MVQVVVYGAFIMFIVMMQTLCVQFITITHLLVSVKYLENETVTLDAVLQFCTIIVTSE